jgi:hypothetical protein
MRKELELLQSELYKFNSELLNIEKNKITIEPLSLHSNLILN